MGVERLGTSCPAPPSATCPSANPSRNCTGKQLGRQWPTGGNPGYYRLDLPKVSGYDACCEECKSDYACKRFMGGKRGRRDPRQGAAQVLRRRHTAGGVSTHQSFFEGGDGPAPSCRGPTALQDSRRSLVCLPERGTQA